MKYTNKHGETYTALYGTVEHDLYADLVAAIHIARAYQERCERLEEQVGSWATAFSRLQHQRDLLVAENARLRSELDRLELVS